MTPELISERVTGHGHAYLRPAEPRVRRWKPSLGREGSWQPEKAQRGSRDHREASGSSSLLPHELRSYFNNSADGASLGLGSRKEHQYPFSGTLWDSSIHTKDSQLLNIHQDAACLALKESYRSKPDQPVSDLVMVSPHSIPCGLEPWPLLCVSAGIHPSLSPIQSVPWSPSRSVVSPRPPPASCPPPGLPGLIHPLFTAQNGFLI